MARCCSCSSSAQEPGESALELELLEANENSITVSFGLLHDATSCLPFRAREKEFLLSVVGGPNGDIYGPRVVSLWAEPRHRVTYKVQELQPSTEYTLTVTCMLKQVEVSESIEVRTAKSLFRQFDDKDFPQVQDLSKDSKTKEAKTVGIEQPNAALSARLGAAQGLSSASRQRAAQRGQSGDDTSTIAPSDAGLDETPEGLDENWDRSFDHAEQPQTARSLRTGMIREATLTTGREVTETEVVVPSGEANLDAAASNLPSRTAQCNLCSMLDCLRGLNTGESSGREDLEVIVVPRPAPRPEAFRPYRIPFPGTPVDPATVGLTPVYPEAFAGLQRV